MMAKKTATKGLNLTKGNQRMKDAFSSPWASAAAIIIAIFWTIPTFGLLVSSVRPEKDINATGWWTILENPNFTLENYQNVLFLGSSVTPPLSQYFFNSFAITIPAAVFPLTIAVFAAYALAWFDFKGKDFIFFSIFALQVIPLQMSLVPLLQLFAKGFMIGEDVIIPDRTHHLCLTPSHILDAQLPAPDSSRAY
jgi:alpha-glucoside transport system permease protein